MGRLKPTAAAAATSIECDAFTANWAAHTCGDHYYLDVATDAAFTSLVVSGQSVSGTSYTVTGLTAATQYWYRVRVADGATGFHGVSRNSNVINVETITCGPPAAPVATDATNLSCASFQANWDASSGATSYRLDVSTDPAFGSFVSGFDNLNVGNSLNYTVSGLSAGQTYHYRVRAFSGAGTSANSNVIEAVTINPLVGTISVGPSGTYTTLVDALTALTAVGIQGNVTFELENGTYTADHVLPAPTLLCGATSANTITIRAASGNLSDVTINPASTWALSINNAHSYRLEHFTSGATNSLRIQAAATNVTMGDLDLNRLYVYTNTSITGGDVQVNNICGLYNANTRINTDASSHLIITPLAGSTDPANFTTGGLRLNAANNYIAGNLIRFVSGTAGRVYHFPMGDGASGQRLASMVMQSATNVNFVTCRFVPGPAENMAGCGDWPIIDGFQLVNAGTAGYWEMIPDNAGSESINYDLRLNLAGMGTFVDDLFAVVSRPTSSVNRCDWAGGGAIPAPGDPGRTLAGGYALRTGLTSFSQKGIGELDDVPLPVVLSSFTATPTADNTVTLRWATRQERNSASFRIERASLPSEGFSPLLTQPAAGNSEVARNYEAQDLKPLAGRSYYRLVQIDLDGTEYRLDVIEVNIARDQIAALSLALRPNPVERSGKLTVDYYVPSSQPVNFTLVDMIGRTLWHSEIQTEQGWQEIVLPMADVPAGIYYLNIHNELEHQSRKLVVVD